MTSTGSGRKRTSVRTYSAEDQALNQIAREEFNKAETRLAARRAARNEAREIRMRELEKQQREVEEKSDRHYEIMGGDTKKELMDLEDKYKKAMMTNAQLDNEKQTYRYQVDLLKDQMEEMEEQLVELGRLHKDTSRDLESHKRDLKDLQVECTILKEQLKQRDELIQEYGLVFIPSEGGENGKKAALVTPQAADILEKVDGSLDEKLKSFASEKKKMEDEIKRLKQDLEDERERSALAEKYSSPKPATKVNGPDMQLLEAQMEAQRLIQEYKFKLKKAEQDITNLEGNVIRLESQVKRYKQASENSEKLEEELKQEKRQLQRQLRESQQEIEDLQTQNHHLQKRLEKIKSNRSAALKS